MTILAVGHGSTQEGRAMGVTWRERLGLVMVDTALRGVRTSGCVARDLTRWARPALAFALALTVADCSSQVGRQGGLDSKYGVRASPKVIPDGQPIPRAAAAR